MENFFQHSKVTLNNFDLIRLFAATQVAISHISSHLEIAIPGLSFLSYFPGVPIFFFISGYLIYQSFANLKEGRYKIFFTKLNSSSATKFVKNVKKSTIHFLPSFCYTIPHIFFLFKLKLA